METTQNMTEKKMHYYGIDFLRAFSCIEIIVMHVKANTTYEISGFYDTFISSLTQLVYLFIMVSGFGMCTGYHEKISKNQIDLDSFYGKRYKKTLPFFAFLLLIAVIIDRNAVTTVEALMELTLTYGLLPNNELDTIGVSWTLGVIFLFYFLFPFIVFLTKTKKRAVLSFIVSILINYACSYYFFTTKFVIESFSYRHSFIYCTPYFFAGALIYLYRDELIRFVTHFKWIMACLAIISVILYYIVPDEIGKFNVFTLKTLLTCVCLLVLALGCNGKLSKSKLNTYLSSISMEMYLCQMVLFRAAEKMHLLYIFGKDWLSFLVCNIIVIIFIIIFVECFKHGTKLILNLTAKKYQR